MKWTGGNTKGYKDSAEGYIAPGETITVLEINFFADSKYLLSGIKRSSKTNIPSSKYWWLSNSPVAILCQIYSIWIMLLTIWDCVLS